MTSCKNPIGLLIGFEKLKVDQSDLLEKSFSNVVKTKEREITNIFGWDETTNGKVILIPLLKNEKIPLGKKDEAGIYSIIEQTGDVYLVLRNKKDFDKLIKYETHMKLLKESSDSFISSLFSFGIRNVTEIENHSNYLTSIKEKRLFNLYKKGLLFFCNSKNDLKKTFKSFDIL